jgi:hypothetical protein
MGPVMRRGRNRLYYITIEDESILAEAVSRIEPDVFAITFKVAGAHDVFVTTHDTKEALDRHDVPYNLLAEEDCARIALLHSELSREELADYDDAIKALALAYKAIAAACVGVNGDTDLGFQVGDGGVDHYTYFTAPAGHTFIWRLFFRRDDAYDFLRNIHADDKGAQEWAEAIPLDSSKDLQTYH